MVGLATSDAIALGAGIVAVLALGVAVWSVFVARGANKLSAKANTLSEGANGIARESNDIAKEALQHSARGVELAEAKEAERQRQQNTRAVMEAEVSPLFCTVQATTALFRPLVHVRNTGERDSGPTIVRVYMQAGADLMSWDDEHTRHDRTRPVPDPAVKFYDPVTQAEMATQYLERRIDNITPTMPVGFRVILPLDIPGAGEGAVRRPVRVTVRAANADKPYEWIGYVQTEYGPPPA
jgi:hypothetical protein